MAGAWSKETGPGERRAIGNQMMQGPLSHPRSAHQRLLGTEHGRMQRQRKPCPWSPSSSLVSPCPALQDVELEFFFACRQGYETSKRVENSHVVFENRPSTRVSSVGQQDGEGDVCADNGVRRGVGGLKKRGVAGRSDVGGGFVVAKSVSDVWASQSVALRETGLRGCLRWEARRR